MMMFLLGAATAGAAFIAGVRFECIRREQKAIRRRKQKAGEVRRAKRAARDTLFFATVESDAPGARR